jgi:hypothetical protein
MIDALKGIFELVHHCAHTGTVAQGHIDDLMDAGDVVMGYGHQ